MTEFLDSLDLAVDRMLARIPGPLAVGAPLGIGKPHRLLNVLYGRVERDASRTMALYTALSLDPPSPGKGLEGRFLGPFVARHFRSEEHTSELQSLMRISYAVLCLETKK